MGCSATPSSSSWPAWAWRAASSRSPAIFPRVVRSAIVPDRPVGGPGDLRPGLPAESGMAPVVDDRPPPELPRPAGLHVRRADPGPVRPVLPGSEDRRTSRECRGPRAGDRRDGPGPGVLDSVGRVSSVPRALLLLDDAVRGLGRPAGGAGSVRSRPGSMRPWPSPRWPTGRPSWRARGRDFPSGIRCSTLSCFQ